MHFCPPSLLKTHMDKREHIRNIVNQIYTNTADSFSTTQRVHQRLRKMRIPVSQSELKDIMSSIPIYTKYRTKYNTKNRNESTFVPGPYHMFQIDLLFMQPYRGFIGALIWYRSLKYSLSYNIIGKH